MRGKELKIDGVDWVVDGELARASAPPLTVKEDVQRDVDAWIKKVKTEEIKSIICLLDDDELEMFYDELPGGLLEYYAYNGFSVKHIPAPDYQSPPLRGGDLRRIWNAFESLPKPVLIHCRHGVARTGHALDHIESKLPKRQTSQMVPFLAALPLLGRLLSQ